MMLGRLSYYTSPRGGARAPYSVKRNELVFELITSGEALTPCGREQRGPGWIFVHHEKQKTIWLTPAGGHYECMAAAFRNISVEEAAIWPRYFEWPDQFEAVRFVDEVLRAFHYAHTDPAIIGALVLSQFRFRLDQYQRSRDHSGMPRSMTAVIAFVNNNYSRDIGVKDMAAHIGISPSHLHLCFKKHMKTSPYHYLTRQRMRAARHALATSHRPVKAIAQEVGYSSAENFCRIFKQQNHITAAEYRKRNMVYEGA